MEKLLIKAGAVIIIILILSVVTCVGHIEAKMAFQADSSMAAYERSVYFHNKKCECE